MKKFVLIIGLICLIFSSVSARFNSIDPKASKFPSISPYAYANNNPIRNIDPDGKETKIYSIPITGTGQKHIFTVIKNNNLKVNTSRGYYPKNRGAAIVNMTGSDIQSGNDVLLKTDLSSELGEVNKLVAGQESNASFEATISPPDGMTVDQFDQIMINATENYDLSKVDYGVFGPNSNTILDNVVEGTGAVMPDISGATAQNYGEKQKKTHRKKSTNHMYRDTERVKQ